MNAKFSVFNIFVEAIIHLLLYNLHDCTFKYLRRVSPQSLQTFQLTAGLKFGCSILVFYH